MKVIWLDGYCNQVYNRLFWGAHGGIFEDSFPVGCDAVLFVELFPKFR
jgi:hypothetical protein